MSMRRQLEQEIDDISTPLLFNCYHEERGGHTSIHIRPDVDISYLKARVRQIRNDRRNGLRRRLRHEKDGRPGEASACSIFLPSENPYKMIQECLWENIDFLEKFLGSDMEKAALYLSFDRQIGIAVLEEGNWDKTYPCSDICVLVTRPHFSDRLFLIKTAFPDFNSNEADEVFDGLEEWFKERRSHRK